MRDRIAAAWNSRWCVPVLLFIVIALGFIGFYLPQRSTVDSLKSALRTQERQDTRLTKLRGRIARIEDLRLARRKQVNDTDRIVCERLEQLKTQQREDENRSYRLRHRNLELLRIPDTSSIEKVIATEHARALKRLAPQRCSNLPTSRQPVPAKK